MNTGPTVSDAIDRLAESMRGVAEVMGIVPDRTRRWQDVTAYAASLLFAAFVLWLVLG